MHNGVPVSLEHGEEAAGDTATLSSSFPNRNPAIPRCAKGTSEVEGASRPYWKAPAGASLLTAFMILDL
jgi:hypothetical protein